MKIESEVLIAEVGRIIGNGQPVILPVSGRSMLPFVVGGKEKIEFRPIVADLQPGDVVMAKVREGYYVVHRIVGIDGDQLTLEGDGNLGFQEHCQMKDVVAQGVSVIDGKGRRRSLTSPEARRRWRVWMRLKPVRRILLKLVKIL